MGGGGGTRDPLPCDAVEADANTGSVAKEVPKENWDGEDLSVNFPTAFPLVELPESCISVGVLVCEQRQTDMHTYRHIDVPGCLPEPPVRG